MKIAVMTWFQKNNYGTVLQMSALTHVLEGMGHEVDIIQYMPHGKVTSLPRGKARAEFVQKGKMQLIENKNPVIIEQLNGDEFQEFRKRHLHLTRVCETLSDLESLNDEYDAFICGSADIWLATKYDPHMFLDFVENPEKMIAYAPCILQEGMSDVHIREKMGQYIARFRHLSVREESGRKVLDEQYGIKTEEVADPVLLMTAIEWQEAFGEKWVDEEDSWTDHAETTEASNEDMQSPGTAQSNAENESVTAKEAASSEESVNLEEAASSEESVNLEEAASSEESVTPEEVASSEESVTPEEAASSEKSVDTEEAASSEESMNTQETSEKYILIALESDHTPYWDAAYKLSSRLNLHVRVIPLHESDLHRYGVVRTPIGPSQYVDLIRKAQYVCTDSYHALLLSIVFQKEICCFYRYGVGAKEDRNERIRHILDAVGMQNRLYEDEAPLERYLKATDYIPVRYKLDALRLKSHTFLINALSQAKRCSNEPDRKVKHVREGYTLCCGCSACADICPQHAITMHMASNGFLEANVNETLCVRCGKCTRVCPLRGERRGVRLEEGYLLSYTDENTDELNRSNSGAFAWRLSQLMIKNGTAVVGCAFDQETMKAKHMILCPDGEVIEAENATQENEDRSAPLSDIEKAERANSDEAAENEATSQDDEPVENEATSQDDEAAENEAALQDDEPAENKSDLQVDELTECEEVSQAEEPAENEEAVKTEECSEEEGANVSDMDESAVQIQNPYEVLHRFQGARFMQSDLGGIWTKILSLSYPVIFFGTPCQVAAAREVLREKEDIIYVDMICSGVPTALLFDKYRKGMRSRFRKGRGEHFDISFNGSSGESKGSFFRMSDGMNERKVSVKRSGFGRMLKNANCMGEFCYECRWRDCSCADIRMGNANGRSIASDNDTALIVPTKASIRNMLSAGYFGHRMEDVSVLLCMTQKGKAAIDLLMTEGYWEGLHKQAIEPYLRGISTKNRPKPVYYEELISQLGDEKSSMRKILNEFAKPVEKREKTNARLRRFTLLGRRLAISARIKRVKSVGKQNKNLEAE